jgi:hypothetical protein
MFDIGDGVLKNVLKRAECPASFMAWAAAHGSEQERLAVAMNPQAQADVLQAIERKGGKAAQAAQQHANHPLASGEGDLELAFRKAVEQAIAQGFTANDVPTLAQWPATGRDVHSFAQNPSFKNVAGGDWSLTSASVGRDTGTDVGVTRDYQGGIRPRGAGFDMGAYER